MEIFNIFIICFTISLFLTLISNISFCIAAIMDYYGKKDYTDWAMVSVLLMLIFSLCTIFFASAAFACALIY